MDWATLIAAFLEWSGYMVETFGYAGIFIVSILSTATIILPVPGFLLIMAAGTVSSLNLWLVAIISGAGMAIGELTGYAVGKGGGKALSMKDTKWLKKGEEWFRKGRGFLFIMIFAATPLPDDVTGILGGAFSYDLRKFLLATFIGKVIMNIALVFTGYYGFNWLSGSLLNL
jgi:membrane protein DedA with SNARE-associated domain